jgi:hypothetical protein
VRTLGRANESSINGFIVALTLVCSSRSWSPSVDLRDRAALRGRALRSTIGLVLFSIFGPAISTLKADVAVWPVW